MNADDKLELRLWLRLLACTNLIEKRVRRGLRKSFDITLPRFDVLAQLERAEDGLTMGELSGHLMVSAGNITGLIDRLVAEGLVARNAEPGDRRAMRVRLTDAGRARFYEMTPVHERWVDDMLAGVDREKLARLHELLGELKDSVAATE